jgi:hypothetical protein
MEILPIAAYDTLLNHQGGSLFGLQSIRNFADLSLRAACSVEQGFLCEAISAL